MSQTIKQFGQKSHDFICNPPELDAKISILEGEVRSAKTWTMMAKLIRLVKYEVDGLRIITGASKSSIYNNILTDLFDVIGRENYKYNRQSGELYLFGQAWSVIGAKDEGSEKFIRGQTIGIAYSDELTLMPESFWKMLLTRLSPEGARLYGTTNTDNPYHYLKADYIDNEEMIAAGLIRTLHFTMADNPNLSLAYRRDVAKMYKGVFYLRFIKGLWVIAEGAIYRDVLGPQAFYTEEQRPISLLNGYAARYISCDIGTVNPTVFLDVYDDGATMWQEREYYWDSQKEMKQKTNGELADDFEVFVGSNRRGIIVIVDPAAAGFKLELVKRGFMVKNAKNDVSEGIVHTSSALNMGKYRIRTGVDENGKKNNENTKREMETYSWNKKAALRGEEEPIKQHDHGPDAVRYCCYTALPANRIGPTR